MFITDITNRGIRPHRTLIHTYMLKHATHFGLKNRSIGTSLFSITAKLVIDYILISNTTNNGLSLSISFSEAARTPITLLPDTA